MKDATAKRNLTVAAIDLGSNTFRLLVAGFTGDKAELSSLAALRKPEPCGYKKALPVKRNITVKLGQGLSGHRHFTSGAIAGALAALKEFRAELDRCRPDCRWCCGTEALRRADNAGYFLVEAERILGMQVEVLSGIGEARLSSRGAVASLDPQAISFPLLVVDVGGSSTELACLVKPGEVSHAASLPAGARLFSELAVNGGPATGQADFSSAMRKFLADCPALPAGVAVVGVGGTATTAAMLDLALGKYDANRVHGHRLSRAALDEIAAKLRAMPVAERQFLPGLDEGRGDIILAGIEIYQEILATICVDGMIISDSGLLEGIMLSCLNPRPYHLLEKI